jgi:hypothetical protein
MKKGKVMIKNRDENSNLPYVGQIKHSEGSGFNTPLRLIFASFKLPFFHLETGTLTPHYCSFL